MRKYLEFFLKFTLILISVYATNSNTAFANIVTVYSSSTYIYERENSTWPCSSATTFSYLELGLRAGSNGDFCDAEERGIVEFSISSTLPNANEIASATLVLNRISGSQRLDLHGFQSDGVVSPSDGNTENILKHNIYLAITPIQIDVTSFIKEQKAKSSAYVSFMLDNPDLTFNSPGGNGTPVIFAAKNQSGQPYLSIVLFNDSDNDGLYDQNDNCPNTYNPDQLDLNHNNIGDACENNNPIARAGNDQAVFDSINLDGGSSTDPENDPLTYSWQIDHRTNSQNNQTKLGSNPLLQNLQPGFYDVTLTVSDGRLSDTDTMVFSSTGPAYTPTEYNQMVSDKDSIIANQISIISAQNTNIDNLTVTNFHYFYGDFDKDFNVDGDDISWFSGKYGFDLDFNDDHDGDNSTEYEGDCNDFNILINPSADEVCGDLTDNNCDGQVDEQPCVE